MVRSKRTLHLSVVRDQRRSSGEDFPKFTNPRNKKKSSPTTNSSKISNRRISKTKCKFVPKFNDVLHYFHIQSEKRGSKISESGDKRKEGETEDGKRTTTKRRGSDRRTSPSVE